MRIATWNAARGRPEVKLARLYEAYRPQVVALQEIAKPFDDFPGSFIWEGTNKNQGLLVWAAPPLRIERIARFKCKTELYAAARVHYQGVCVFNVVNVWVKPYENRPKGDCPYGYSLDQGLSRAMKLLGAEVTVVLGDTNILNPDSKDYYREFLCEYGLFSAYHEFFQVPSGGEKRPTHRHRTFKSDHHIDFCFLPRQWQWSQWLVTVGSPTKWVRYSDHFPIVVDIDDTAVFGHPLCPTPFGTPCPTPTAP
jgi:exonuclease III